VVGYYVRLIRGRKMRSGAGECHVSFVGVDRKSTRKRGPPVGGGVPVEQSAVTLELIEDEV